MTDNILRAKILAEARESQFRATYRVGTRVKASHHAYEVGRFQMERKRGLPVEGVVTGLESDQCIRVRIDGRKHSVGWHSLFWEVVR